MCFLFGGLRRREQHFNTTVAQTAASLLALAVAAVIVPTVFDLNSKTPQKDVAQLSRGTSLILLCMLDSNLLAIPVPPELDTGAALLARPANNISRLRRLPTFPTQDPFRRLCRDQPKG